MPKIPIIYKRPPLTDYQLSALFHHKRYGFIEGTTKCGKTYGGMTWLGEQAMFGKFINYWWVAPVYPQAKIAFTRLKYAMPENICKANETDLTLTLPNKHILWFKSGEKPDNLFGEDVGAAMIDEGSRMREESWHAIRSTLTATRGPLRAIGNVKGRKNWFYNMCRKAESGDKDMHYAKITAHDAIAAGILSSEEIDDAKRMLPEQVFNELYLAIPSEDGGNPFGLKHIALCVQPLSTNEPFVYGVDLAKSVDYTVIIGLDESGHVCRFERFQKPWKETKEIIRETVGQVPALVDSTGVGDPVLEDLQRGAFNRFEGYQFTSPSKQKLMEGLTGGIQHIPSCIIKRYSVA